MCLWLAVFISIINCAEYNDSDSFEYESTTAEATTARKEFVTVPTPPLAVDRYGYEATTTKATTARRESTTVPTPPAVDVKIIFNFKIIS